MGASGMKRIGGTASLQALRVLLSLFVAWGAIIETTCPEFAPFHLAPGLVAELYPGTAYTWITWRFEQRGWPFVFLTRTNLPERAPGPRNDDVPLALACDLTFVGILAFAAWSVFRGWRKQVALADTFAITASLAAALAFQAQVWGHPLDYSKIAVDVGIFSAAFMALHNLRRGARLFFRQRPGFVQAHKTTCEPCPPPRSAR
jgi:hypothetical protein